MLPTVESSTGSGAVTSTMVVGTGGSVGTESISNTSDSNSSIFSLKQNVWLQPSPVYWTKFIVDIFNLIDNLDSPSHGIILELVNSSIVMSSIINGFSTCPAAGFSKRTSKTTSSTFSIPLIDHEITKFSWSALFAVIFISASSIPPALIKNKNIRKTEKYFFSFIQTPQLLSTCQWLLAFVLQKILGDMLLM